jgi:hypothetical protein
LLSELDLQTPLADAEIASAATWNAKIGGAVSIGQVAFGTDTGVIGGDAGLIWDNTNKRLGIGTSTPTARLHVQAQGALSTDIGFRVRNSANTANLFDVQGNGNFIIGPSNVNRLSNINGTAELSGTISTRLVGGGTTHDRSLLISSTDIWLRHDIVKHQIGASSILWRSRYNGQNNVFELIESTKQSNILVIGNGTGIVSNPIYNDAFQLYSADRGGTAGKASAHFRAEDGTINVIGDFSGFGTDSPQARLDVRAQGALSTDIAFRVRNSTDTVNNFQVNGLGHIEARATVNTRLIIGGSNVDNAVPSYYSIVVVGYSNTNSAYRTTIVGSENTNTGTEFGTIVGTQNTMGGRNIIVGKGNTASGNGGITIGFDNNNRGSATSHVFGSNNVISAPNGFPNKAMAVIGSNMNIPNNSRINNTIFFGTRDVLGDAHASLNHDNFMISSMTPVLANYDINSRGVFYTKNGVAPTTLATDSIAFYSADITAGNSAPHFRTENGSVIKLYQETTAIAEATFVANTGNNLKEDSTFDGYTMKQVVKALRNMGILA